MRAFIAAALMSFAFAEDMDCKEIAEFNFMFGGEAKCKEDQTYYFDKPHSFVKTGDCERNSCYIFDVSWCDSGCIDGFNGMGCAS